VASHFQIPVFEQADVTGVNPAGDGFELRAGKGTVSARTVVWAEGEFHHPGIRPSSSARTS
jgi:pyridine nucleotide-disulfide oxidoreductase